MAVKTDKLKYSADYLEAVIQPHKKRKWNWLQYSLFVQRVFYLLQLNHLQTADKWAATFITSATRTNCIIQQFSLHTN